MSALLRLYFNIAFLMGKPQELPGGRLQLQIGVTLSLVTYVLALTTLHDVFRAVAHAVADLFFSGLFFYVGLRLVNHANRFEQAFGGLCGAGAVLNLAAIPIFLGRPEADAQSVSSLAIFAEFLLLVWSLSLFSHVVRHTFELGKLLSTFVAFAYIIVLVGLMDWLMPIAAPTG